MKNKKIVLLILGLFVFFLIFGGFSLMRPKDNDEKVTNSKKIKLTNQLSMMLETRAGTGEYEMTTRSTWPTDGYIFNTELSKCENGGKLSWNDENNTVVMIGSTSDKCYVYFDVYNLAVINNVTEEVTTSSIKLTVNATVGTKPITKYYYSKDNGTSYIELTSNTYTFSGLTNGTTYNIKVYALDENGKSSAVYSKSIKTDNTQMLADYVKSLYSTQGANGLYLHNSSLANSANDNSYRYAGSNPNNYVCFGSDLATCPSDNLYRIIGVFGNQAKLIKYDYATSAQLGTTGAYYGAYNWGSDHYKGTNYSNIASYHWTSSDNSSNVWSGSALNITNLNGTYLTNLGITWANKIAETSWKVGGNTWSNIAESPMNTAYHKEIITPAINTTYSAKIGLMYVSDYGYAASPTYWTYKGYNSNDSTNDYSAAVNNNWMYMGLYEWTISRRTDRSDYAFGVNNTGSIYYHCAVYSSTFGVRPCFCLNQNVTYVSGNGTFIDPIRVG